VQRFPDIFDCKERLGAGHLLPVGEVTRRRSGKN
jgi:hypothetical protein